METMNIVESFETMNIVESVVSTTTLLSEETKPAKKHQGRPRKYEYLELEATNENEPKEEVERIAKSKYSSQYYQNHKDIKVICPICLKNVQKYSIGKHQKTKYCQLVATVEQKRIAERQKPQSIFYETVMTI